MVDVTALGDQIEEERDLGSGDAALWAYWMAQEKIAEREESPWIRRARKIISRYRDERPESARRDHRFNILWSNVQTLIPTLYARTPKPDVERRFKDADPVGRLAAILWERAISYQLDTHDFDSVMQGVVQDKLLPGRGVARVLYVPHFGEPLEQEQPEGDDSGDDESAEYGKDNDPLRNVDFEEVRLQYVFWEDYREGPARTWEEVPWTRYRSYMTRDELVDRFKEKGKKVNLDFTPKGTPDTEDKDTPPDLYKKAVVFEFWDKRKREVCWLAPGTPDLILDQTDDPIGLQGFFPSPNPLLATTTTDKRIPVPDFIEYQDQAREIDELTSRIYVLAQALKVAGVYPGEEKAVLQQLVDAGDNKLIPVSDYAVWAEKGGLKNFIDWFPIQQVAETLIQLYNARDRAKQVLYEITGLSDILRGETNPNETATAQELKSNFATRRILPQQNQVARFARDSIRLIAGVIAGQFSPKTISMITGYPQLQPVPPLPPMPPQYLPLSPQQGPGGPMQPGQMGQSQQQPQPNPAFMQWQQQMQQVQAIQAQNAQLQQQFDAAVALIKQDGSTDFRLDIEADSTIAPDEQAEKQARTEFLQQMVPLMEQIVPMATGNPALADLAKEVTLFAVRGFRAGRPMEEAFEKAFDQLGKMPPPPPEGGKAAGPTGPSQQELQLKAQAIQADTQTDMAETQSKAQIARQANAVKMQQIASDAQIEREKMAQQENNEFAHLALEQAKLQSQEAVRRERIQHMESQSAQGLV